MKHPELPFSAFLAAFLVLVPLPWHWRARNVGTLALIAWLFVVNFIYGINSIIWADNVRNPVPVWCDITTKIVVGASYALPIATMCICKHLEMVASARQTSFDYADRRHRMVFESVMCFGLPMIFMALHYIVQGHRFDIVENTGCQATVYISLPAVFIIWLPQLLFSVIATLYALVVLYHFIRRRLTFASHLRTTNSALTANSYLRLVAMVITEMLWGITLTSVGLRYNVVGRLHPWTSWSDVHYNFSRVDLYPEFLVPQDFRRVVMALWWAMPVSSFIFFIFFGFGAEAQKEYLKVWNWFRSTILRRKPSGKKDMMKIDCPVVSRGLKPLKLAGDKDNTVVKFPPISNPTLISSSNPSLHTLIAPSPTKPESQTSQFNTTKGETSFGSSDSFNISTFSIYVQPYDLRHSCRSPIREPTSAMTQDNSQPPQLPEIPLTPPLSASPPPSPTLSVPESVGPTFYKSPPRPGCLPSPVYHRPFCGPSIYPVARPHPSAQHGVVVTIHRQASVDEIV